MAKQNHLFQLVQSLNKQEKRFFKLSSSIEKGEKQYLKLFDILVKQKEYNEDEIAEKLGLKKNMIAFQKNYLYQLILKCMAFFYSDTETQVRTYLNQANFLHSKGLYDQYKKVLSKAKEIANRLGKNTWLLEITEKEALLAWKNMDVQEAEILVQEEGRAFNLLKNEKEYSQLEGKIKTKLLRTGSTRKPGDVKELKKMIQNPLLKNEGYALTFYSKQSLYQTLAYYYSLTESIEKGFLYSKKIVDHYTSDPEKSKSKLFVYLGSMCNLIGSCILLNKYKEAKRYLELFAQNSRHLHSEKEKSWAFSMFNYYNLDYYIKTGCFEEAIHAIEKEHNAFRKYEDTSTDVTLLKILLYFNIAVSYFGVKRYNQSIEWLNKIRNEPSLDVRPDIETEIKLFYIIVHYEKGNYDLLPHLIKSTYRYLLKKNRLYDIEKNLLEFMGKSVFKIKSKQKLIEEFTYIKKQFHSFEENPDKRVLFQGPFDYISWFESKIENRAFAEIVRAKARKFERA